jgi:hypothetical protein
VALLAVILAAIVGYVADPADAGLPAYVAFQHPDTTPVQA